MNFDHSLATKACTTALSVKNEEEMDHGKFFNSAHRA